VNLPDSSGCPMSWRVRMPPGDRNRGSPAPACNRAATATRVRFGTLPSATRPIPGISGPPEPTPIDLVGLPVSLTADRPGTHPDRPEIGFVLHKECRIHPPLTLWGLLIWGRGQLALFGAFLTTTRPEPRAIRSIRGEPGNAANRQAFASPSNLALPQRLHDPQIRRVGFHVSMNTPRAALPLWRRAGLRLTPKCQRASAACHHSQYTTSSANSCEVPGTWSLLDGTSATEMGSLSENRAPPSPPISTFSLDTPCACSSLRSIVTSTPAARRCALASCSSFWPGGGWIAGCSRGDP
jgi:hypothetical protein